MSLEFKKGDILFGRYGSEAIHPIVFFYNIDHSFFCGVMLTSKKIGENIPLSNDFIKESFRFKYKNTHFVKSALLKKTEWVPFKKIGEITDEGITFIESHIDLSKPLLWEEY